MKIQVFLLVSLCSAVSVFSQTAMKEGKITYERVVNVHKRMPPEAEQFKAMVPEFQTTVMELFFNATASLYKPAKVQEDQMPGTEDGGTRRIRFGGGGENAETYRDYTTETMIESRELGPKKYLLDDSLKAMKWKLEEETKVILGYTCKKATSTVDLLAGFRMNRGGQQNGSAAAPAEPQKVEAWYTDQIETMAGPDAFFGLPGLILELNVDEGTVKYTTKKIDPLGSNELVKAPTAGKKITRQEYRQMMQQQFQGGGGVRGGNQIIIRQ